MYVEAVISLDPAHLTEIVNRRPTKLFAKLANALSGGTEQEERETFTAVSILQQLNQALRSLGINDIVRVSKDGQVFYEDTEGRKDDLKQALTQFANDDLGSDPFRQLRLLLQHTKAAVEYLIAVEINRTHPVGEYPIRIVVDAVPTSLNAEGDEDRVRDGLKRVVNSQETYDQFTSQFIQLVESFVDSLVNALKTHIHTDDVHANVEAKLIQPGQSINRFSDIPKSRRHHDSSPIYDDYYGGTDAFFYAWIWSSLMQEHQIQDDRAIPVDESGREATHEADNPDASSVAGEEDSIVEAVGVEEEGSATSRWWTSSDGDSTREHSSGWLGSFMDTVGDFSFGGDSDGGDAGGCSGGCGGGCGGD